MKFLKMFLKAAPKLHQTPMQLSATIAVFLTLSTTLQAAPLPDLPAGGRMGFHGMVIYGAGHYILDHIPMLAPPHDFQVLADVFLKTPNGQPITADLSQKGFTFKPNSTFSLNDYITGKIKSIKGAVHSGSFELGGAEVPGLEQVEIEVLNIKLARQLPSTSIEPWFQASTGANDFLVNLITPQKNLQLIKNQTSGDIIWCVKGPDFVEPCD